MTHEPTIHQHREGQAEQHRGMLIAGLYERHASTVERLVAARARTDRASIQDACQTAWTRLCAHPEVDAAAAESTIRWLVVTATREAWKLAGHRVSPAGAMIGEATDAGELAEPAGGGEDDPLELAIAHEAHRERRALLLTLTARERQFLALQAAGLSYLEITAHTGASARTVERQILRARAKLKGG